MAVLLWPIGVLTGDDDDGGGGSDTAAAAAAGSGNPAGAAVVLGQGTQRAVQVQATGLAPSTQKFAYQFWLYDSKGKARSLGAQVTDQNGTLQAIGNLPEGFEKYRYFDLSQRADRRRRRRTPASPSCAAAMPQLGERRGRTRRSRGSARSCWPRRRAEPPASPAAACRGSSRRPGRARPSRPAAASMPSGPTSACIQGRWSRPTAWWWVIVPPVATIASEAAALAARH